MTSAELRELGPREVHGDEARLIARADVADRTDWLQADVTWFDPALAVTDVASALAAEFAGMRVATTDRDLAAALVAAGGRVARFGTQMEYDVRRTPPPPEWLDRSKVGEVALVDYRLVDAEIAAAWLAAYPPEHLDHDPALTSVEAAVADLGTIQSGTVTGVFSDASVLAIDDEGAVRGGIMVTLLRPNPHWDGPWVPDVFVHPDAQGRGIGVRLVRYSVAAVAAAGHVGLALSVTDGNVAARRVYEKVGFVPTVSFTSVAIP